MQIDWITVSAQIVNFLVLVYLLQHFLYRPVVRAMDRREQRIADRLNEAERRESDAEEIKGTYQQEKDRLERERQDLLEQSRREAREEKQRLLDEARNEVEETKRQWQRQLSREKREFLENLRKRTAHTVTEVAGKALADLADAELEERVIDVFIRRLAELDDETLGAFTGSGGRLRVATGYELGPRERGRITRALHETINKDLEVEYGQSPGLICGIRVGDDGHALDWNLADYMVQITERMDSAIDEVARQS